MQSDRFPTTARYLQYQLESVAVYPSPSILLMEDLDLLLPTKDSNCAIIDLFYRWLRHWCRPNIMSPCIIGVCQVDAKLDPLVGSFFKVSTAIPKVLDLADRQWAVQRLASKMGLEPGSALTEAVQPMMGGLGFDALVQLMTEALCLGKAEDFPRNLGNMATSRISTGKGKGSKGEITWDSIAGLEEAKKRLIETSQVLWDADLRASYARLGITPIRGILLHGPPGTGKTLLAKALASQSRAAFFSVSIPELVHAQVGASEKSLAALFTKALESQPAIIFFDELDAIFQRNAAASTGQMMGRLLAQFDRLRVDPECNILVIGATNFVERIGPELMTFGRMECRIECLPSGDVATQLSILRTGLGALDPDLVDPGALNLVLDEAASARLKMLSGAEVGQVLDAAKRLALKRSINANGLVSPLTLSDIQAALYVQ
jgi:hypothetical protein